MNCLMWFGKLQTIKIYFTSFQVCLYLDFPNEVYCELWSWDGHWVNIYNSNLTVTVQLNSVILKEYNTANQPWVWTSLITALFCFSKWDHYFASVVEIPKYKLGRSLMIGWRKKSWNPERVPSVVTLSVCVSVCLWTGYRAHLLI